MPLSAIDAIGPAFQHAKQQLFQPFRIGQWARLALVGVLAGELSSGGGWHAPNFQIPLHTGRPGRFLALALPPELTDHPALVALAVLVAVFTFLFLGLVLIYVSSVMRFILFDSVLARECRIREGWSRRMEPGFQYFIWHLLVLLVSIVGLVILIGIPAAFALAAGWLRQPREHILPLVLGGIVLFFLVLAFVIALALVHVMTKDFVVPQMALENISAIEGWRRLLPRLAAEKGGYAGYIVMKILLAIAAAVVIGIICFILVLLLLIPIGILGIASVLAGKAAGLTWTVYTITLAVLVGLVLLACLLYVIGLISVPVIVFFPAYSIYFFAGRYPALAAILWPPPSPSAAPTPLSPPEPPPLPPTPAPIA
jgi:hypothetical protein